MNFSQELLNFIWIKAFQAGFRRGLVFCHGSLCPKCKKEVEKEPAWIDSPDLKEVPR